MHVVNLQLAHQAKTEQGGVVGPQLASALKTEGVTCATEPQVPMAQLPAAAASYNRRGRRGTYSLRNREVRKLHV